MTFLRSFFVSMLLTAKRPFSSIWMPQPSCKAFLHETTAPSHQPRMGLYASPTTKTSNPLNGRFAQLLMSTMEKHVPAFWKCLAEEEIRNKTKRTRCKGVSRPRWWNFKPHGTNF